MSDFNGRMMNIPTKMMKGVTDNEAYCFRQGHRQARHIAAEIANEADQEIWTLNNRIEEIQAELDGVLFNE